MLNYSRGTNGRLAPRGGGGGQKCLTPDLNQEKVGAGEAGRR